MTWCVLVFNADPWVEVTEKVLIQLCSVKEAVVSEVTRTGLRNNMLIVTVKRHVERVRWWCNTLSAHIIKHTDAKIAQASRF